MENDLIRELPTFTHNHRYSYRFHTHNHSNRFFFCAICSQFHLKTQTLHLSWRLSCRFTNNTRMFPDTSSTIKALPLHHNSSKNPWRHQVSTLITPLQHAQIIGMIERSHHKLNQIHKNNLDPDTPEWDRYVNLAVMEHITTYHQTINSFSTEVFHGRVAYNALDFKFTNPIKASHPKTDIMTLIDHTNEKYKSTVENSFEAFQKYRP